MIQRITQCVQRLKRGVESILSFQDYFEAKQKQSYCLQDVLDSIKHILSTHAIDYCNMLEMEQPLHVVTHYLIGENRFEEVEELLSQEEDQLFASSKYVLHMYKSYLEKVVPANITFYHFIREKEYYAHLVALRYFMVVGIRNRNHNIFSKFKYQNRCELFLLLLDWLFNLIKYRCSAIYLSSGCVDPLIYQTNLVLAAVFGFDERSLFGNMLEHELNEVFNKIMYINGYLLAVTIPAKNYMQVNVVLIVTRKLLKATTQQKVTEFIPSYLFAKSVGYLPAPYSHQIIFRLLIDFAIKLAQERENSSAEQLLSGQIQHQFLLIDIWSVLLLMVQEYSRLEASRIKDLVKITVKKLDPRSMIRAFVVRIAFNLHLQVSDEAIKAYMGNYKLPYLYEGKVVTLETFCKNYNIVMEKEFLLILSQTAKGKMVKFQDGLIWSSIMSYNKFQIVGQAEYLERISLSPSSKGQLVTG